MTAGILGANADIFDVVQDLANRIATLEQAGGFGAVDLTPGGSDFPGGITIGTGPGTVIVTSAITTPTTLALSAGTFFNEAFIDVSWVDPDTTIATVEVFWAKKNATGGTYQPAHSDVTGGTALRVQPVNPGSTYGVKIVARNNIGVPSSYVPSSGYTDIVVPLDSTIPNAPTGLTLARGADTIVAKWTEVTDLDVANGAGLYQLQLSHDAFSTIDRDIRVSGSVASFDDLTTTNASYQVRVRAVDSSNNVSTWTTSSTFTGGAVDGTDILAHSVAAVKIVANTITASEIAANTITATEIAANAITASELSAVSLAVGKYIRSNNYVAGSAGWNIDASGTAEFSNAVIRGSTFTGSLSATTIVGGTITGAFIQSASSAPRTTLSTATPGTTTGGLRFDFARATDSYISGWDLTSNGVGLTFSASQTVSANSSDMSMDYNGFHFSGGSSTGFHVLIGSSLSYDISSGSNAHVFGGNMDVFGNILALGGDISAGGQMSAGGLMITGTNWYLANTSTSGAATAEMRLFVVNAGSISVGHASQLSTGQWAGFYAGVFNTMSSRKLKRGIKKLTLNEHSKLHDLRPVTFAWKHEGDEAPEHMGFIAEEVEKIWPSMVAAGTDRDGKEFKGMNYSELIPALVAEIQKLRQDMDRLEGAR